MSWPCLIHHTSHQINSIENFCKTFVTGTKFYGTKYTVFAIWFLGYTKNQQTELLYRCLVTDYLTHYLIQKNISIQFNSFLILILSPLDCSYCF